MLSKLKIDRFRDRFFQKLDSKPSPIDLGIRTLDNKLNGLAPFVVILGEPKCCKSTILTQIAAKHLAQEWPLLWFDRENGHRRTIRRLMCSISGKCWDRLATYSPPKLNQMYDWIEKKDLFLSHDPVTPEVFHEIATAFVKHYHDKPCLIFLDSIQALRQDYNDRRSSIDKWLDCISDLKLEYEDRLVIVCTSEKNRAAYGETFKGGSKESGAIEYKAEQLLYLRAENNGMICVTILENRDGPDGVREGQVYLEKVLEDGTNPRSFVYRLQESMEI